MSVSRRPAFVLLSVCIYPRQDLSLLPTFLLPYGLSSTGFSSGAKEVDDPLPFSSLTVFRPAAGILASLASRFFTLDILGVCTRLS